MNLTYSILKTGSRNLGDMTRQSSGILHCVFTVCIIGNFEPRKGCSIQSQVSRSLDYSYLESDMSAGKEITHSMHMIQYVLLYVQPLRLKTNSINRQNRMNG
jgi:hypothetical protein